MKRNIAIDIAKGLGIILVVWGHTSKACPIHNEIYLFHMPLFFILSGYFFKSVYKPFLQMLQKKFQAYILPYFFFMALCLSMAAILYAITGELHRYKIQPDILINPGGVVTALWFLPCLFEVQIEYYLIQRYMKKEYHRLLCCVLLLLAGYFLSLSHIHIPLFLDSSLSMVLFFHIGRVMKQKNIIEQKGIQQVLLLAASIGCYTAAILLHCRLDVKENFMDGNLILLICSSLGASYATIYLSYILSHLRKIFSLVPSLLSYLGRNTMIIFTLHILGFEVTRHLFGLPSGAKATFVQGIYLVLLALSFSLLMGYPLQYVLPHLKLPKISRKRPLKREE
jgi:fucose 4-O-acetylase-like acetyltransferase